MHSQFENSSAPLRRSRVQAGKEGNSFRRRDNQEARLIRDCVLLLVSVEKGDDDSVIAQAIVEIQKAQAQLGHRFFRNLSVRSSELESGVPRVCKGHSPKDWSETSPSSGLSVHHVPFGWNKALTMKVKGHPLAEQSKFLKPSKDFAWAREESRERNRSRICCPKGRGDSKVAMVHHRSRWKSYSVFEDFNFAKHKTLEKLKNYETAKVRAVAQVPPHVNLMKKLGLVDYEPASDPGNMRFYPKGRMMKSLIERYVTQRVLEYGGVEVETPIMYDFEHPALGKLSE